MEKDSPERLPTYQKSQSRKHWLFHHCAKKPEPKKSEPKEWSQNQGLIPYIAELRDMTSLQLQVVTLTCSPWLILVVPQTWLHQICWQLMNSPVSVQSHTLRMSILAT